MRKNRLQLAMILKRTALLALGTIFLCSISVWAAPAPAFFANPICEQADPWFLQYQGHYLACFSETNHAISVQMSDRLTALGKKHIVWTTPPIGPTSDEAWAPELHLLDGRWYIYFAADDGENKNHRMFVLAGKTSDPLGEYSSPVELQTEGWAIDGTILANHSGERFFVWSGWAGCSDGQQNLYISRMASPVELAGSRVLLTTPDQPWERQGMPICEGPQILTRGGKTFIVYSASASWTADYCLAMLVHEGGDLTDATAWQKTAPIFTSNEHAWGVGHCGFLQTPEGENWLFYHAKTSRRAGWTDREVRAQPYSWTHDGMPKLNAPVPRHRPLWRTSADLEKAS